MNSDKYQIEIIEKKISSFVYTGNINSSLNLYHIFENLKLSDVFLGMKFNNKYKGIIKKTKCMFNHITLNCLVYGKKINIKFSKTGSFQVTGVQYINQIYFLVDKFINEIKEINGEKNIKIINLNGFLCDYSDYLLFNGLPRNRFNNIRIYSNKGEIIGHKNGDTYYINNIELKKDKEFNVYYGIKRNSLVRDVYNTNGENIGTLEFVNHIKKDGTRLPLEGKFIIENVDDHFIYKKKYKYKNETIIQHFFSKYLHLNKDYTNINKRHKEVYYLNSEYNCIDKSIDIYKVFNLKLVNANATLCFDVQNDYYVDVSKCIEAISKLGYTAYNNNTSKYPVVSIKIYTDNYFNIKSANNYEKCFSISYYYLTNKVISSNAVCIENIKFIETIFTEILNEIKDDIFIKKKEINKICEKISLKNLL